MVPMSKLIKTVAASLGGGMALGFAVRAIAHSARRRENTMATGLTLDARVAALEERLASLAMTVASGLYSDQTWKVLAVGAARGLAWGTLAGFVILMLYMYYSSFILLLGAEMNQVIELHSPGATGLEEPSTTAERLRKQG